MIPEEEKQDIEKWQLLSCSVLSIGSVLLMIVCFLFFSNTEYNFNVLMMFVVLLYLFNVGLSIYLLYPYDNITEKRKSAAFSFIFVTLALLIICSIPTFHTHNNFMNQLKKLRGEAKPIYDSFDLINKMGRDTFNQFNKNRSIKDVSTLIYNMPNTNPSLNNQFSAAQKSIEINNKMLNYTCYKMNELFNKIKKSHDSNEINRVLNEMRTIIDNTNKDSVFNIFNDLTKNVNEATAILNSLLPSSSVA
jgi:hypothetical protein